MGRKLFRSDTDKKIAGVCGGIAQYFNIDPTIVRIAWALAIFLLPGISIVAYLVAWFVMPGEFDSTF